MTKKQTKQEITAENNGHVKFNVYNGKGKSKELKTLEELKEDFKKAFEQNGVLYQEDVLDALGEKNMTLSIPKTNATFKLGDATVKVLYVGTEDESDLNDTSIVLKVTYQNVSFLLTGDASTKVEEKLNPADLESTVLKVGHHGSSTATNEKFLNTVNPKYAIISVGENNQYEHPHTTVLNTLAAHNITTYRTDQDGTIKVITDGTNIEINTSKTDTNG